MPVQFRGRHIYQVARIAEIQRKHVGFQSPVRRMFERLGRAVVLVDEAAQDRMADDLRWLLVARRWADG
jgi:hypothetical protein